MVSESSSTFKNYVCMCFVDEPEIGGDTLADDTVMIKKKGEQITINIFVRKNTPARVKWFFNAAPINSSVDERIQILNENSKDFEAEKLWREDRDASLLINNITCTDAGFYQVEISNPVKTDLFTYNLNVDDCKY